jgi:hypothetical protein
MVLFPDLTVSVVMTWSYYYGDAWYVLEEMILRKRKAISISCNHLTYDNETTYCKDYEKVYKPVAID